MSTKQKLRTIKEVEERNEKRIRIATARANIMRRTLDVKRPETLEAIANISRFCCPGAHEFIKPVDDPDIELSRLTAAREAISINIQNCDSVDWLEGVSAILDELVCYEVLKCLMFGGDAK